MSEVPFQITSDKNLDMISAFFSEILSEIISELALPSLRRLYSRDTSLTTAGGTKDSVGDHKIPPPFFGGITKSSEWGFTKFTFCHVGL